MQLERIKPEGHLRDQSSNVFVSSPGPLETNSEFAKPVITNMAVGSIEYRYVFQANTQNTEVIGNLITSLVGVNEILRDGNPERRTPSQNLETIHKLFRISFLEERPGIHYCIHNANQEDYAICYLRCPKKNSNGEVQFVEWCRYLEAVHVTQEIIRMCVDPPEGIIRVFDSTVYYDLYEDDNKRFLKSLRAKITDKVISRFPDITADMVRETFFPG